MNGRDGASSSDRQAVSLINRHVAAGGWVADLATSLDASSIRGFSFVAGQATAGANIDNTPIQVGTALGSGNIAGHAYPLLFGGGESP